jgi:hypothetical protein
MRHQHLLEKVLESNFLTLGGYHEQNDYSGFRTTVGSTGRLRYQWW